MTNNESELKEHRCSTLNVLIAPNSTLNVLIAPNSTLNVLIAPNSTLNVLIAPNSTLKAHEKLVLTTHI